jgi:hypothetical protein
MHRLDEPNRNHSEQTNRGTEPICRANYFHQSTNELVRLSPMALTVNRSSLLHDVIKGATDRALLVGFV